MRRPGPFSRLPRISGTGFDADLLRALNDWWSEYREIVTALVEQQAMMPSGAGAPTELPPTVGAMSKLYLDTSTDTLYAYHDGAWHSL